MTTTPPPPPPQKFPPKSTHFVIIKNFISVGVGVSGKAGRDGWPPPSPPPEESTPPDTYTQTPRTYACAEERKMGEADGVMTTDPTARSVAALSAGRPCQGRRREWGAAKKRSTPGPPTRVWGWFLKTSKMLFFFFYGSSEWGRGSVVYAANWGSVLQTVAL